MANSFKDILITPNKGVANVAPRIDFKGANNTSNVSMSVSILPENGRAVLKFEGNTGQLMSIIDSITDVVWSANDVSGMPIIEAYASGDVKIGFPYGKLGVNTDNLIRNVNIGGNGLNTEALISVQLPGQGMSFGLNANGFVLYDDLAGASRFVVGRNGKIGIGIDNSSDHLEVYAGNASIGISGGTGTSGTPAYTNLNFRGYAERRTAVIRSFDQSSSVVASGGLEFLVNPDMNADVLRSAVIIDSVGRVGFGTTPSRILHTYTDAANAEVYIESSGNYNGRLRFINTVGQMSVGMIGAPGVNSWLHYDNTSARSIYQYVAGANDYHLWYTGNTEKMRLHNSGNVSIGTTSEAGKLFILATAGKTPLYVQGNGYILFDYLGSSSTYIDQNATYIRTPLGNTRFLFNTLSASPFFIQYGGMHQLARSGYLLLSNADDTNSYYLVNEGPTGSANAILQFMLSGVGEKARFDKGGNLLLGITSSTGKIHGYNNAAIDTYLVMQNSLSSMYLGPNATGDQWIYMSGAYDMMFATNSLERMRLKSGGNLEIYGNVTTSGHVNVNNGVVSVSGGGLRVLNPGGGSNVTSSASRTGALKVRLPVAANASTTMMRFKLSIYEYNSNGEFLGTSATYEISGYNYTGTTWYNVAAVQLTTGGSRRNIRFGNDGTSQCIWIGETSTVWDYPQVFLTDVQAGYSAYHIDRFSKGWDISFVTAFDNVYNGPTLIPKVVTTTSSGGVNLQDITNAFAFSAPSTAGFEIGARGTGSSLLVNTPSLSSSYNSGLAVDGSYGSLISTVNLKAFGVYSGGGYASRMAFYTALGTTLSEKGRFDEYGNFMIGVTSVGTGAANTLAIVNGTPPGSNIAGVQLFAQSGVLKYRNGANAIIVLDSSGGTGYTGSAGSNGATGYTGSAGATGATGYTGSAGTGGGGNVTGTLSRIDSAFVDPDDMGGASDRANIIAACLEAVSSNPKKTVLLTRMYRAQRMEFNTTYDGLRIQGLGEHTGVQMVDTPDHSDVAWGWLLHFNPNANTTMSVTLSNFTVDGNKQGANVMLELAYNPTTCWGVVADGRGYAPTDSDAGNLTLNMRNMWLQNWDQSGFVQIGRNAVTRIHDTIVRYQGKSGIDISRGDFYGDWIDASYSAVLGLNLSSGSHCILTNTRIHHNGRAHPNANVAIGQTDAIGAGLKISAPIDGINRRVRHFYDNVVIENNLGTGLNSTSVAANGFIQAGSLIFRRNGGSAINLTDNASIVCESLNCEDNWYAHETNTIMNHGSLPTYDSNSAALLIYGASRFSFGTVWIECSGRGLGINGGWGARFNARTCYIKNAGVGYNHVTWQDASSYWSVDEMAYSGTGNGLSLAGNVYNRITHTSTLSDL